MMERMLRVLSGERCMCYLDDIICLGKSFEDAVVNLQCVFDRLKAANLCLKPKKCNLFQRQVTFLGHLVNASGVQCDPEKVAAVVNWEAPSDVTGVRSFLGFCNYYRKFIRSFAQIASPLTALTEKGMSFVWSDECQVAFQTITA